MIRKVFEIFEQVDRRVVFLLLFIVLSLPLIAGITLHPARMETAEEFYAVVETLKPEKDKLVLISMDWGPGTSAENKPQTMVTIEHLMRKRIPFAVVSTYQYAIPFLKETPQEVAKLLEKEIPTEKWEYGKDWINLGFKNGSDIFVQGMAKSENLIEYLKTDANGTPLEEFEITKNLKTIQNFSLLVQVTGLLGTFSTWIQYFQTADYRPPVVHGCTSITIPEAFIFLASKQIVGLFEGVAGAAWYEALLEKDYPKRLGKQATLVNTGLSYAQIFVVALIILGNIGMLFSRKS